MVLVRIVHSKEKKLYIVFFRMNLAQERNSIDNIDVEGLQRTLNVLNIYAFYKRWKILYSMVVCYLI